MALKTPFLAEENSAAVRRSRALHRFIVASPMVLLLAVGIIAHRRNVPYPRPAGGAAYDAQVLAYVPRVAAVRRLDPDRDALPGAAALAEGRLWQSGLASGKLAVVRPAMYEDHLRDGVRGEILRSGLSLATCLAMCASQDFAAKPLTGLDEALLSAQIAHGLRNFELQAYLQALMVQRRALSALAEGWASLPASGKATARKRLKSLLTVPTEVAQLAKLDKGQQQEYSRRRHLAPEDDVSDFGLEEETAAAKRSAELNNARVRSLIADKPETVADPLP